MYTCAAIAEGENGLNVVGSIENMSQQVHQLFTLGQTVGRYNARAQDYFALGVILFKLKFGLRFASR